jgi:hypothetical protein
VRGHGTRILQLLLWQREGGVLPSQASGAVRRHAVSGRLLRPARCGHTAESWSHAAAVGLVCSQAAKVQA